MESLGAFLDTLRLGEGWPGIQQESEWPNSVHSRVHLPVIATSGRGLRSAERHNKTEKQSMSTVETAAQGKVGDGDDVTVQMFHIKSLRYYHFLICPAAIFSNR